MDYLAIDIETIPDKLSDEIMPKFDPENVKLGNLKDPAKIKQRMIAEEKNFEAKIPKLMSLDPMMGQIICIGFYDRSEKASVLSQRTHKEIDLLKEFLDRATKASKIVTKNGYNFDLPFIKCRMMLLDVQLSREANWMVFPKMFQKMQRRYGSDVHVDIQQELSNWDLSKTKKLPWLAKRFGLEVQNDENGSKVFDWWLERDWEKIESHCIQDVLLTAKIYERMEKWYRV